MSRMEKRLDKQNWIKSRVSQLSTKSVVIISIHVLLIALTLSIGHLDFSGKIALFAFLSAMTLWITTKIPAGFVAITLIMFIIMMNAAGTELLYESLSEKVVWLMIGSFIIGEAVKRSGLAERLTRSVCRRSTKKSSVLFGIGSVFFASAFFIPSTSGRAALSRPIVNQLGEKLSTKEQRVLAIITPVLILMSTSATLIGAGSHLIGVSLLESTSGQTISYLKWFLWGVPFALVVTLVSFFIIKWCLWPKGETTEMDVKPEEKTMQRNQLCGGEKKTLILISFLIAGWMTETIHGYDIAFITMIGAILVMIPKYGIIRWKEGLAAVSWNLILFVAAATALGKVLVDTGVVHWIENEMLHVLHLFVGAPDWLIVFIILVVTVTSHLYITSHTTRAIIFIPSLLMFSETIGVNPVAVVFLSLVGMNYCVTFPVSSKALLFFYEEGDISYDASNLLKMSALLMPLYILLMMLFYFSYWQWVGMGL